METVTAVGHQTDMVEVQLVVMLVMNPLTLTQVALIEYLLVEIQQIKHINLVKDKTLEFLVVELQVLKAPVEAAEATMVVNHYNTMVVTLTSVVVEVLDILVMKNY